MLSVTAHDRGKHSVPANESVSNARSGGHQERTLSCQPGFHLAVEPSFYKSTTQNGVKGDLKLVVNGLNAAAVSSCGTGVAIATNVLTWYG